MWVAARSGAARKIILHQPSLGKPLNMRPGHFAQDSLADHGLYSVRHLASMRPGLNAPDNRPFQRPTVTRPVSCIFEHSLD